MFEFFIGIGLCLIITVICYLYIIKQEFLLSLCVGITITVASSLFPVWAMGIPLLLIGIYIFQEFFGGEGGKN